MMFKSLALSVENFAASLVELFHAGDRSRSHRARMVKLLKAKRARADADIGIDMESLRVSERLSADEIATRYRTGRVAEMSEHHAGL